MMPHTARAEPKRPTAVSNTFVFLESADGLRSLVIRCLVSPPVGLTKEQLKLGNPHRKLGYEHAHVVHAGVVYVATGETRDHDLQWLVRVFREVPSAVSMRKLEPLVEDLQPGVIVQ